MHVTNQLYRRVTLAQPATLGTRHQLQAAKQLGTAPVITVVDPLVLYHGACSAASTIQLLQIFTQQVIQQIHRLPAMQQRLAPAKPTT